MGCKLNHGNCSFLSAYSKYLILVSNLQKTLVLQLNAKAETGQQGDRVAGVMDCELNHSNYSFLGVHSKDLI